MTLMDNTEDVRTIAAPSETPDYFALNAMSYFYKDKDKKTLQLDKDKEAARQYFLTHVNSNTQYFHDLEEKLEFLFEQDYYEREVFEQYDMAEVKGLYKYVYDQKFRFPTFYGAYKFYNAYALKSFDGKRYLERFEDRVAATALYLARGDIAVARAMAEEIISGRYQPATPTFLNAAKAQRGELVSCFLVRTEDNMESISNIHNAALQMSKRGGGVAFNLTNLREAGAPIKKIEGQSSGILPVMKMLEDAFSYSNQLGARPGAGAVYLHLNHPDIYKFLDTKRENADEKIRVKTLSLGVVIPDIAFELAKNDEDLYMFSPYDIERVMGKPMSDLSVSEHYRSWVENPAIRKTKTKARKLFQTLAELSMESGYPYLLFEDTANKASNLEGRINMSNLCSEILQVNTASTFNEDGSYNEVGQDISCNLGSMNVAKAMYGGNLGKTVNAAVRALTAVSDLSNIGAVPSIAMGNSKTHAIGLGQMNLAGFFASEKIHYGSPESIDFTSAYFAAITYHAVKASNEIAIERGETFESFKTSKYASGEYFVKYLDNDWTPKTEGGKALFEKYGIALPSKTDWFDLAKSVQKHGIYNGYLQAVPPTGSISYINHSTASIHPISAQIEIRKEGSVGRLYYPAFGMNDDNREYYRDSYIVGPEALVDIYAAATEHVDQGLSCTLFIKGDATTRDITKAHMYAWKKGLKTIYYTRVQSDSLAGTDLDMCVSCAL
jgi:ribonucleoside-diphosphate reductase alpha chain